jgi:hypothetical protein
MIEQSLDPADSFRHECFCQLGIARHYGDLTQGFLEIGDDSGAVYAMRRFIDAANAASREMRKLRAHNIDKNTAAMREAAE